MINISKSRIHYRDGRIEEYESQSEAYAFWLGLPRGVRAAFRGAGDATPVYAHDYVDAI
ncbi:MAG: hypothetical protein ACLQF0_06790 [Dissulfurispiraceae bacterium]